MKARLKEAIQRRVVTPVLDQLRQGITPEKLALSLAVGVVVSVMPVLGVTTLVALAFSFALRLNHPAVVASNYAAYPLQILLYIPFFRAGAWVTGGPAVRFSIDQIEAELAAGVWPTVVKYAGANTRALVAWLVVAPLATFVLYRVFRPLLARLPIRRTGDAPPKETPRAA